MNELDTDIDYSIENFDCIACKRHDKNIYEDTICNGCFDSWHQSFEEDTRIEIAKRITNRNEGII